jgi:hypothetical protein
VGGGWEGLLGRRERGKGEGGPGAGGKEGGREIFAQLASTAATTSSPGPSGLLRPGTGAPPCTISPRSRVCRDSSAVSRHLPVPRSRSHPILPSDADQMPSDADQMASLTECHNEMRRELRVRVCVLGGGEGRHAQCGRVADARADAFLLLLRAGAAGPGGPRRRPGLRFAPQPPPDALKVAGRRRRRCRPA